MSGSISTVIANTTLARDLWRITETGEVAELHDLLGRGVEIDVSNDAGTTALMIAAYHGRLEMVRALTDHGANVNLMDNEGFTAATLAHRRGHDSVVRLLVARGAKKTPAPVLLDSKASRFAQNKTSHAGLDKASIRSTPIGALPESPNIWDVVPETQIDFDPRRALISHLPPANIVGLVAIALIVVGGTIFLFLQLRDIPLTPPAASLRRESASTPPASASPNGDVSSPAEQSSSTATEPANSDSATQETPETVVGSDSPAKPKTAVVTKPAEDSRAAKPHPEQSTSVSTSTDSFSKDNQTDSGRVQQDTSTPTKSAVASPQTTNDNRTGANEVPKPEIKKPPQNPSPALPAKPNPSPNSL